MNKCRKPQEKPKFGTTNPFPGLKHVTNPVPGKWEGYWYFSSQFEGWAKINNDHTVARLIKLDPGSWRLYGAVGLPDAHEADGGLIYFVKPGFKAYKVV